jgi:hypothetical protein
MSSRVELITIRIAMLLCFSLLSSGMLACGTVKWAIDGVYGKGPMSFVDTDSLYKSLAQSGGPCRKLSNNQLEKNEERLVALLLDDDLQKHNNQYGESVFTVFGCLMSQQKSQNYVAVYERYSPNHCPTKGITYISTQSGINLRSSPRVANNKLTTLKDGVMLEEIERDGNWVQVNVIRLHSNRAPKCKYKSPCIQGYVHKIAVDRK